VGGYPRPLAKMIAHPFLRSETGERWGFNRLSPQEQVFSEEVHGCVVQMPQHRQHLDGFKMDSERPGAELEDVRRNGGVLQG